MKTIIIIYGSSGGNTEIVCQKVAEVLQSSELNVILKRVENCTPQDIFKGDLCILAAPTYEHGIILDHFLPFLKELKQTDLKGHQMAVIALGDTKYDMHYHLESANTLVAAIKESKGSTFHHPLRISGLPFPHLDGRITKWAQEISSKIFKARGAEGA
jgi:flavodoxin